MDNLESSSMSPLALSQREFLDVLIEVGIIESTYSYKSQGGVVAICHLSTQEAEMGGWEV